MDENEITSEDTGKPLLEISRQAIEKATVIRAQSEQDPESRALWVTVSGVSGGEYIYKFYLSDLSNADPANTIIERYGDLAVVVPKSSVAKLRGAILSWTESAGQEGFAVENPNKPPDALAQAEKPSPTELPMMGSAAPVSPPIDTPPPADLSGDVAQRVSQVLEQQVNPAIAAHGGHAELVAVEDDTVYLRLGGGCQGCGMATVTLGQGIEVAIIEVVPEIAQVIDVTDHATGSNPYFESAKK